MSGVVVKCADIECKHCKDGKCIVAEINHTDERICIAGRCRIEPDYKRLMRNDMPIDFKRCGKDVYN